jgi:hypothetical protein
MDKEREDALDFVRRRALIPNRMYPTDRQAENQERAEESLADAILTFAKQYAAREGEADVNGFKSCPFYNSRNVTCEALDDGWKFRYTGPRALHVRQTSTKQWSKR